MKHGILNALRQTQAQDNSLESLSQLPQIERNLQHASLRGGIVQIGGIVRM
jgi:hypothetical protein